VSDLDERLRREITALADARSPSERPEDVLERLRRGGRGRDVGHRGRWLFAAAAAAVAVVGVVAGTVVAARDEGDRGFTVEVGPPDESDSSLWTDGLASLAPGWHHLDSGPMDDLMPLVTSWTGDDLVVLSARDGAKNVVERAFALSAKSEEWRPIAAVPSELGRPSGAAWTGDEVIAWGPLGVVRWDPIADRWSAVSSPTRRGLAEAVWADGIVVFWTDGLVYDVVADEWREVESVPQRPERVATAWTGSELVVLGMAAEQTWPPGENLGYVYDPVADRWREIAPSGLSGNSLALAWTGLDLIGVDYDLQAARYDLATDTWSPLPRIPLSPGECYIQAGPVGELVLVDYCGIRAALTPDGRWLVWDWSDSGLLVPADDLAFTFGWMVTPDLYGEPIHRVSVFVPPRPSSEGAYEHPRRFALSPGQLDLPTGFGVVRWNPVPEDDPARRLDVVLQGPGGVCTARVVNSWAGRDWSAEPGAVEETVTSADGRDLPALVADGPEGYGPARVVAVEVEQLAVVFEFGCPQLEHARAIAATLSLPALQR
jgi:hypothetical protein